MRYILITIDVFSRYLWVIPLRNKPNESIIEGIRRIFGKGTKPKEIRTDKGSEFKNRYLKRNGVHHYVTHNVTYANYAERVIRTLKVQIFYS